MTRLAIDCVLFCFLALSSVLIADALSAPVPRPRPAPPPAARPALPGLYDMAWYGSRYRTVLWAGGQYEAGIGPDGPRYVGTWRLDGDTLTIRERAVGSDWYAEKTWELVPGKLASACGHFELRRLP